ncbi:MAG: THUMP domain-containing class I SAM-dependent RNA methyltransferase [Chitinophagales bacterium]
MTQMELVATTFRGLESVLAEEITQLGATVTQLHTRAVSFMGDKAMLYKANLHLRTAIRILMPLNFFEANNEDELYNGVKAVDWSQYMTLYQTFVIRSVANSEVFTHSKYAALKSKDAIIDQFREKFRMRPNINRENPDVTVHLHINNTTCKVYLDSSGESLHKRGYRVAQNQAPLSEVLAAGMILLSGWKGDCNFVDPMCGSGTLLIEAAMIAQKQAPQLWRKQFGFQKWPNFDRKLWRTIRKEALGQVQETDVKIIGSDIEPRNIKIAIDNIIKARVDESVRINTKAFEERTAPKGGGVMIMNPPYGQRMQEANNQGMFNFYEAIGDTLKQNWAGYEAWIISSNLDALKHVGLATSKRLELFNGPLECKFHCYELYEGTREERADTPE